MRSGDIGDIGDTNDTVDTGGIIEETDQVVAAAYVDRGSS